MVIEKCAKSAIVYDKIIIDEAQDLISDEYLSVLNMSIRGGLAKGKWIMFGDFSMQAIFSETKKEFDYLEEIQKRAFFAMFRLTKNCRNTKKICIDIENIVGVPENAAYDDDINVPCVNHVTYDNEKDQLDKLIIIIDELRINNIKMNDIVILSPKKRTESVVSKLEGIQIKDYTVHGAGQIRFSTLQAFKGLESSAVILTDIESYEDEKLIYVGLSRARFCLYVLENQVATSERKELFYKRRLANDC